MTVGDQWFLIGTQHDAGRHTEPILGCARCLKVLEDGMRAAHENYDRLEARFRQMRNLRSSIHGFYKRKAKLHRERAALNRENHRLLQNAHRKTLRKLEWVEGMSRMERRARAAELAYILETGATMRSMGLTEALENVREFITLAGNLGLGVESVGAHRSLMAVCARIAQLSGTAASSAQAPAPRLPSPEYGCAGVPLGLEPWDDDP